jgi:hypothetical protein
MRSVPCYRDTDHQDSRREYDRLREMCGHHQHLSEGSGGELKMYTYAAERTKLFTDEGQRLFLAIRDRVERLLKRGGAVRMDMAIAGNTGDPWLMLACVDRLVEIGEIREIQQASEVAGQYRIFVKVREK